MNRTDIRKVEGETDKDYRIRWWRIHEYGVSPEILDSLLVSQNGKCAVCGFVFGANDFHIDHDRCSGNVRGLLCQNCNKALGHIKDDIQILESLLHYLRKHSYYLSEWPPNVIGIRYETEKQRRTKKRLDRVRKSLEDSAMFE